MPRNRCLDTSTTALAFFAVLGLSSAAYAGEPQTPTPDQQSGCTTSDGVSVGAGCGSPGSTAAQGGVPGQAGKAGTAATGGAPGAAAASGTQGGPPPDRSKPSGGSTEGQGVAGMAAKAGTAATGGAPGAAAAAGSQAGCPPDKAQPSGGQGGGQPDQAAATPSTC